jgi:hypothetical protein
MYFISFYFPCVRRFHFTVKWALRHLLKSHEWLYADKSWCLPVICMVWLWSSRNDFIATYSSARGVTFKVLPLSSYPHSAKMPPLLETLLELLVWNSSYSFSCLQYTEIFVHLKLSLILQTAKVIRSQIRGIGWVFHFNNRFLGQKLLDRERLVSWSIVENPIVGSKFRPFSTHGFT